MKVTFFRIKFTRHMIMSLLWENRWFEKEIISVLRLTRKWSSQSISNSEVFFRHFWRFELGTIIISGLFLDFSKLFENSDTLSSTFLYPKVSNYSIFASHWFESWILTLNGTWCHSKFSYGAISAILNLSLFDRF